MRLFPILPLPCMLLATSACCCQRSAPAAGPDAGGGAGAEVVLERLYLGMSSVAGPITTDALDGFLASEVTPRFPDGLTLYGARGQWRDDHGAIAGEPTTVLEIAMPNTRENRGKAKAIAAAYCRRFHQEAVLEVVAPITMALLNARSDQAPAAQAAGGTAAAVSR